MECPLYIHGLDFEANSWSASRLTLVEVLRKLLSELQKRDGLVN